MLKSLTNQMAYFTFAKSFIDNWTPPSCDSLTTKTLLGAKF